MVKEEHLYVSPGLRFIPAVTEEKDINIVDLNGWDSTDIIGHCYELSKRQL